jgi:signal transduction histidine kinase
MKNAADSNEPKFRLRWEHVLCALALAFAALMHTTALEDRFLLVLYCLGTAGASYALVRRRALGLAAIVATVVGAIIFASVYYSAAPDKWHPVLDPIRDIAGLGILFVLAAKTVLEMYRYEKEERIRQFRDIVEKKTIEMRAAALRSTSHEVRTPLSTISALTETLLDESAGPLEEMQREFVQDIDQAATHLLGLVNDILDYAKAEAGMIQLAVEPVAMVELVEQCVRMIQPRADEAGISVSAHVAADVKEINADPLRVKQILLNLLANAVKYSGRGGSVNVRVRLDAQGNVMISVRDTGRGIDAEHLPHLFDPYYQTAVADQSIGTGLGLAIIKHLTELHGGTVTVESVVNAGSVFQVTLPNVDPQTVSEKAPPDAVELPASNSPSAAREAADPSTTTPVFPLR